MPKRHYLDLSTAHVLKGDAKLLGPWGMNDPVKNDGSGPIVVNHQYGWWVWVPPRADLEAMLKRYRKAGFSQRFTKVLSHARKQDCDWVNLDQDGEREEGLPVSRW